MSRIFVCGLGIVSPAGWGFTRFREALAKGEPMPTKPLDRPGWSQRLATRPVPPPSARPPVFSHARLRRSSPISRFAAAAAMEALAEAAESRPLEPASPPPLNPTSERLGIILCVMAGCVNYTRRFYAETLQDPATASPLVFPETVFNAPASHIASVLGTTGMNYTLVGDPGTFLVGLALGANWLAEGAVDACIVVGAEELDWLTADASRLFSQQAVLSEGAGAVYLRSKPAGASAVALEAVTDPHLYTRSCNRRLAARAARGQLPGFCPTHVLVDSGVGDVHLDKAEEQAWSDWKGARLSPKKILGEGLAAGGAWQCAAAVDALRQRRYAAANVSIVGCNQQAIGAHFSMNS